VALLRAGPVAHQRWALLCARASSVIDLSGADLRGAQFPPIESECLNLAGANLTGADLGRSWLYEISGARLDGARLAGMWGMKKLTDCTFVGADLSGVGYLIQAEMERCDFTGANLEKATLQLAQATAVVFRQARMSGADLKEARLPGADLAQADLTGADLSSCDLRGADLTGADLTGADLDRANLTGADLRQARLRNAVLSKANLTDARIDGADFEGTNLARAKLGGLDLSRAQGLEAALAKRRPTTGPSLRELNRVAAQATRVRTRAYLVLPDGSTVAVSARSENNGKLVYLESPKHWSFQSARVASLSAGLLEVVRPYLKGSLRLNSVKVTADGSPLTPKKLHRLLLAAWCEACGRPVPAEDQVEAELAADREREEERKRGLAAELRQGPEGVERWNARSREERERAGPFDGIDLGAAALDGVYLSFLAFPGANFEKASLVGAQMTWGKFGKARFRAARLDRADLDGSTFPGASFVGASLREAMLRGCNFRTACFKVADLTGACLGKANLCGADLSTATLTEARFDRARFDDKTLFPPGFMPPADMAWKGTGPDPRGTPPAVAAPARTSKLAEPLNLEQFMQKLPGNVDRSRLANALRMLKAERFQLFSEVDDEGLVGVVKSQTDPDLVYSCRLASDGSFHCCTQNLRPCGGLQGALCKHLLVLIVGLARGGKVDLGAVEQWIKKSRRRRLPGLDREAAGAVFLRYKGAVAGEVDWRPTETIPEDFYAF
jgi:uncharacterized protein YjbI with pentapeptide repeats